MEMSVFECKCHCNVVICTLLIPKERYAWKGCYVVVKTRHLCNIPISVWRLPNRMFFLMQTAEQTGGYLGAWVCSEPRWSGRGNQQNVCQYPFFALLHDATNKVHPLAFQVFTSVNDTCILLLTKNKN